MRCSLNQRKSKRACQCGDALEVAAVERRRAADREAGAVRDQWPVGGDVIEHPQRVGNRCRSFRRRVRCGPERLGDDAQEVDGVAVLADESGELWGKRTPTPRRVAAVAAKRYGRCSQGSAAVPVSNTSPLSTIGRRRRLACVAGARQRAAGCRSAANSGSIGGEAAILSPGLVVELQRARPSAVRLVRRLLACQFAQVGLSSCRCHNRSTRWRNKRATRPAVRPSRWSCRDGMRSTCRGGPE